MLRSSQIVAGILLILYVACGAVLCLLVLDRRLFSSLSNSTSESPTTSTTSEPPTTTTSSTTTTSTTAPSPAAPPTRRRRPKPTRPESPAATTRIGKYYQAIPGEYTSSPLTTERSSLEFKHGFWSLTGTLVMGFSIVIFRLLVGTRIRIVKCVHLMLHVITLILFGIGVWCVISRGTTITYDHINYHGLTSWVVLAIFCVQFLLGITELRQYIAFFHDLIGIWIFICCVACCISGKRRAQLDYVSNNTELFYGLSYVCFTFVLVVILSPFFEWDMLGPL